jgi:hypothetical protein
VAKRRPRWSLPAGAAVARRVVLGRSKRRPATVEKRCGVDQVRAGDRRLAGTPCLAEYLPYSFVSDAAQCTVSRRSACPSLILCQSATSGRMETSAASLHADWLGGGRSRGCLAVALKRAGFAVSRSRTALWEIPTITYS